MSKLKKSSKSEVVSGADQYVQRQQSSGRRRSLSGPLSQHYQGYCCRCRFINGFSNTKLESV